ncbi:ATP-dependent acyl-CoA ligase [Bradyrhizobium sp. CCBAU 53338]|uniref:ATP-dependent acyl-CoA ligase n=1 Tax=Bradyrhizobium sp. CCBAU 53338 TaxID=1325111 RepID=UPI00188CD51E|nr:ATP-dependent acyl-CoA ligase [Bradyrhizobium sp. CCBAU 53338]QOZ52511.1 ATP-dependent acyl-CoA ligase [Bradyrhizobium sp. CCBAU 53338]
MVSSAAYILANERTVPALLAKQAARYEDQKLFVCGGASWTYRSCRDTAASYAGCLLQAGITAGDRVAIFCGNKPELLAVFLGCGWIGAVSVPINTAARGHQLQHMLSTSGAKLIMIEAEHLHVLEAIDFARLPLASAWILGEGASEAAKSLPVKTSRLPDPGPAATPAAIKPSDPLTILFTSGTTGPSKGVVCPHGQFFWWGIYTGKALGLVERDVLHTTLPLFHTNALNCFFQALLHGATQVVDARFSVSNFYEALRQSGATVTYVLGAMVPMLLSRPEEPSERQHTVRCALAPGVPEQANRDFERRTGIALLDGFGSTESNAVICSTMQHRKPGYVGQVMDGFEALIVDEDDNPVQDGQPGELLLRAREPFAMALGYFGMPDKTVEAWRNLWLHTGDRLVRTPDGYFRFIDRLKDTIRRRGENISSFEVEQVLLSHPDVALAAVFPVSSDLAEDEVMTVLLLKDGATLRQEDVVRFCEGKLSYFAIPRFVEFVTDMPRTESGKVQKFKLRARGKTDATWDREAAGVTVKR